MGVITRPNAERNFSGLVSLKRLSEQQLLQRGTCCKRFHLDYQVNQLPTFTVAELSQLIAEFYELKNDVAKALCFCYQTYVGEQQRTIKLLAYETLEGKII
jgi:hypothetical protein